MPGRAMDLTKELAGLDDDEPNQYYTLPMHIQLPREGGDLHEEILFKLGGQGVWQGWPMLAAAQQRRLQQFRASRLTCASELLQKRV